MFYKTYDNNIAVIVGKHYDNLLFNEIEENMKDQNYKAEYAKDLEEFLLDLLLEQDDIEYFESKAFLFAGFPSYLVINIITDLNVHNPEEIVKRTVRDITSGKEWKEISKEEYLSDKTSDYASVTVYFLIPSLTSLYQFNKLDGEVLYDGKNYYLHTKYSPLLEEYFGRPFSLVSNYAEVILPELSKLYNQ